MAVKIRLARHGAKKRPYYRVVVADGRMPRDGRYIEEVGRYNPLTNPKTIDIDIEKVDEWMAKGAQPRRMRISSYWKQGVADHHAELAG